MGLPLSEGQEKSRLGEGAGQEPRSAGVQCGVPTKTPTGHVGLGVRGRPGGVGVHSAEALGWPCPGSRGPLAAGPSASRELSPTQALPRAYPCRPAARPSRKGVSASREAPLGGGEAGVGMPSRLCPLCSRARRLPQRGLRNAHLCWPFLTLCLTLPTSSAPD